jgi:phosphogluconate dehydratase
MRLDAKSGRLEVLVDEDEWSVREPVSIDLADNDRAWPRILAPFRRAVGRADHGASIFEVV